MFNFKFSAPTTPSPFRNTTPSNFTSFEPIFDPTPATPSTSSKRKRAGSQLDKENLHPDVPPSSKRHYTPKRSIEDKLDAVFDAIAAANWSFSEFLYYTFRFKDGTSFHRAGRHAQYVRNFLQGVGKYSAADILDAWFRSPYGRNTDNTYEMYSTTTPYLQIRHIRPLLTSFAAQIVKAQLVREAKAAVAPGNGLHISTRQKGSHKMTWEDIGSATVSRVSDIIQKHQPLTWSFLMSIAANERSSIAADAVERRRPPNMVCTHAISALNFSRNNEARLLSLTRGLLYFAFSVPVDLFAYGSRVGEMPAYSTISRTLTNLSAHEAEVIRAHASNPSTSGFVQIDNVQNYLLQRDQRIGRENKMNVGIAGIYIDLDDAGVDPMAFDLDNKRRYLAMNQRAEVTTEKLLKLVDQPHFDRVGPLHWLLAITKYVPELESMKCQVSHGFRDQCARLRVPVHATKVHPLATSGKAETVTTELKDAMLDFFSQMGNKSKEYLRKLILVGGDGLTYEKLVQLKRYMQFHEDPFESFKLLEPVLSVWHTEWMDLSRIFETHWDSILSPDPSTLGHSAAQIGRSAPPNLKKVDYYPCAEFMQTVLQVRMLDCWRNEFSCSDLFEHFKALAASNQLPTFEELRKVALKLYRTFSTTRAYHLALHDTEGTSDWAQNVRIGTPWVPPSKDKTSMFGPRPLPAKPSKPTAHVGKQSTKAKSDNEVKDELPFRGDRVLANTIIFMRDAIISCEMSYATAEGDVGRVYECMKVMLFTFAGSSHSKYTNYLLETICNLEYESSPALRDGILTSMLLNLTGREGAFSAADLVQEFFNRLLEAIVEKKGVEYGAKFIREVISRNLHHFACIKLDLRKGVGLTSRSGAHPAPHLKPEVVKLMASNHDCELHKLRRGRVFLDRDVDDSQRGLKKMRDGKVHEWVTQTMRDRGISANPAGSVETNESGSSISDPAESTHDNEDVPERFTPGFAELVDGQLVIDTSGDVEFDDLIGVFESEYGLGYPAYIAGPGFEAIQVISEN